MSALSDMEDLARPLIAAFLDGADGMRMFSAECVERQIRSASRPMSRMTIVTMTPAEFLSLASPIHRSEGLPPDSDLAVVEQDKMDCIASGVAGAGLNNLPHLRVEPEGSNARVVDHEGRHRALTAMAMGVEAFPVQISYVPDGCEIHDGIWHLMDAKPENLLGQDGNHGNAVPLPPVPFDRTALGLDDETADALGNVSRTLTRVLALWDPDERENADVRAWAEDRHRDALRWMDKDERVEEAMAHLETLEAAAGPRL